MDLSMPDHGGVDALAAIKAREPDLPVLILSGFPETHYATTLLRQGASGYLNKECDPNEIATAIRTVYRGRKYITPAVAELLADSLGGDQNKLPHELLSERELQVFLRLAKGETIITSAELDELMQRKLTTINNGMCQLTDVGTQLHVELVSIYKASESAALEGLDFEMHQMLHIALLKLIETTKVDE
jgi:YesN/AraC family two-component response regulator